MTDTAKATTTKTEPEPKEVRDVETTEPAELSDSELSAELERLHKTVNAPDPRARLDSLYLENDRRNKDAK